MEQLLEKLLDAADKLEKAAMLTYAKDGNSLSELLIAINYYSLVKEQYQTVKNKEIEDFENYFNQ